MTTDPDPYRKAQAGGSRMLILGPGELGNQGEIITICVGKSQGRRIQYADFWGQANIWLTQQAFEPLVDHDF